MRNLLIAIILGAGLFSTSTETSQTFPSPAVTPQLPPVALPAQLPVDLPATVERLQLPAAPDLVHESRLQDQRTLVEQFERLTNDQQRDIVRDLAQRGYDLPANIRRLIQEGKLLPGKEDVTIFRVIKDEMKPIPVRGGNFIDVYPMPLHPWARVSLDERARLLQSARSVGRIETRTQTTATLHGTGFVVGEGLVATNCHVLRSIAQQDSNGVWSLKHQSLRVDFADAGNHESEREFAIEGIAGFPSAQFLDVALLRVKNTSDTGGNPLPPQLPLVRSVIQRPWDREQLLVAVIGYPDLINLQGDDLTQDMFRHIRESGDYAKLLSPGAVTGVDNHQGLDFLNHVASTHLGQSGSPVIDRTNGSVVGIHYCCASADVPQEINPLACSSQLVSDRDNNEALSTWTIVADSVLGPLLPGSSPVPQPARIVPRP